MQCNVCHRPTDRPTIGAELRLLLLLLLMINDYSFSSDLSSWLSFSLSLSPRRPTFFILSLFFFFVSSFELIFVAAATAAAMGTLNLFCFV